MMQTNYYSYKWKQIDSQVLGTQFDLISYVSVRDQQETRYRADQAPQASRRCSPRVRGDRASAQEEAPRDRGRFPGPDR